MYNIKTYLDRDTVIRKYLIAGQNLVSFCLDELGTAVIGSSVLNQVQRYCIL